MKSIIFLFSFFVSISCFGQDIKTFYDTRVVNGHSVETSHKGMMKFIIAHRFGFISTGSSELWGLDDSMIRLGLDYGISDRLTIGVGRSSNNKIYDSYLKYRLIKQRKNVPFSLTGFGSLSHRSKTAYSFALRENDLLRTSHRLTYAGQLLIASKLTDRLSFQLMPTYLYRNITETAEESNMVLSAGAAARYKIFKRLTLSAEYYYTPDGQLGEFARNSLAIGFNIETKGHVFQLHLGNSRGMIEQEFITGTFGNWGKGEMGIGFNITRDFKLTGH